MFFNVWGHVITDNIRRLWFLNDNILSKDFEKCPIVYAPWYEEYTIDRMPDVSRLMEILGVDLNRLQAITQPTQFDKIILFDDSFVSNHYFTNEYREMMDRIRHFALKNRTPISNKKLYFYQGLRQVGEDRLAEYFKSKGYDIITHKQRSNFDEEINLLINAESFAAPLGSVSHNSVFLRDGTETIYIPRSLAKLWPYQEMLDQVHPMNANYINSTMSIFNVDHESYCYIISQQLKQFFGDKWDGYEEEDFKAFLDYVNSPIRKGYAMNPNELKSYENIFSDFMAQLKQRKDLITSYDMLSDWDTFRSSLTYQTHIIGKKCWRSSWASENQPSNPLDQKLEISAITINYPNHKIYYSVYFNEEEGWSAEVTAGQMAGMNDIHKPIYGMKVWLDEAGTKEFDILYRMHKFDNTWTPWAKNGEELYSQGLKLNAIQIKLESIKFQSDETKPKESAKVQPNEAYIKEVDNTLTVYLQEQMQDLTQINLET